MVPRLQRYNKLFQLVWKSDHDRDTGELCHAGYVPAMRGYLGLWPEVWDAEGRQEFRYNCDNYFALLQIIDDVIYFYFLAEMLVKMVRRNSQ